jgi:hypothetical protein
MKQNLPYPLTDFFHKICPAGRSHCAWGAHFVGCIPLRVALPLVALIFCADQREDHPEGVYKSRSDRRPRSGPVRQDKFRSRQNGRSLPASSRSKLTTYPDQRSPHFFATFQDKKRNRSIQAELQHRTRLQASPSRLQQLSFEEDLG